MRAPLPAATPDTATLVNAGIVRFAQRREADAVLGGWAANIARLLDLVEKSSQQIQKESMVHRVPIGVTD